MEQTSPDVVAVLVEHHRRFREFLKRRVGSHAAAEELLQAAFVKGLEKGGELRDSESAVAWFYRLLVRLHRARQALKQRLEVSCGARTEHGCLDCTCTRTADMTTT